ncbi:leucyl/phenylalanyl-tRNA--protein transferase [Vibrio sp. SCSIO 43136]|uniref:leucyl/phenylalanyl-tRNA--protein transferase n=1 Tax=Vibrio sp. SCSIO 43136 TaxID=2819101 RepID=UPI0020752B7A|nr:leucyl/phenylalanyl-tRNA--protein transferase [Vibrio sp. SCSIO 43136]USD66255.1 leucyl/phenylalanyl-tRNA--protein transferase [Vibrio sp. SCSIO 43136]
MKIYLPELAPNSVLFPPTHEALAEPDGLLAMGGDLSPNRLLAAYNKGIFPWYSADEPILWWSPKIRAVFDPKTFKPSKSLKKFLKKSNYDISINRATDQVIERCANTRTAQETWLLPEMRKAYQQLANLGRVHSVEVWQDEQLVGGLYGVSVGKIFCGESMFSLATNASKAALWYFCHHFAKSGGELIDCQLMNPHLASLGAQELPREEFTQYLIDLGELSLEKRCYAPQQLPNPIHSES